MTFETLNFEGPGGVVVVRADAKEVDRGRVEERGVALERKRDAAKEAEAEALVAESTVAQLSTTDGLRPVDRLHLLELHPQEHAALRRALEGPGVHVHRRDGHEGLPALLPPTPRRGLALIDPSYEVKTEYAAAAKLFLAAHARWPQGVTLLWYPLLDAGLHADLLGPLRAARLPGLWVEEVRFAGSALRLRGSGLAAVNLPYGAEAALAATSAALFGPT